jgi:hypothetical protein
MEQTQTTEQKTQNKKSKVSTTPIRILKSTAKTLKGLLQKLNRKPLGKRIRIDDLVLKSLSLLEDKHYEEIKDASLSNTDRLEINYHKYCKQHGQISKDAYIGQLLNGDNEASSNTFEAQFSPPS